MSRREKEHRLSKKKTDVRKPKPDDATGPQNEVPVQKRVSAFKAERALRRAQRTPGPGEAAYRDEAPSSGYRPNQEAYLTSLPPVEAAQELAFQALEARSASERNQLANRALTFDPDCIDARLIALTSRKADPEKLEQDLRALIAAADLRMASELRELKPGTAWERATMRPYLRARHLLASLLLNEEKLADAAAAFETLLSLDAEDSLGARYPLLGIYLENENVDAAKAVFGRFPDEESAAFHWARAAYHALRNDPATGRTYLRKGMEGNEFVLDMLVGIEEIPEQVPRDYEEGSYEEAAFIVLIMGGAWLSEKTQEFLHEEANALIEQGYPKLRQERD